MLYAVALTVFLGLVQAQLPEFSCPKDANNICEDGKHAHPSQCTQYYECDNCQYVLETCPNGDHFDRYNKTCRNPYLAECDPNNYPRNGSAFCVYLGQEDKVGPINPLVYPNAYVNDKYPYDFQTGYWQANMDGTYFFHLSAGTTPNSKVNVSIAGANYPSGTVRNSSHAGQDVLARDFFMNLLYRQVLAVTLSANTKTSSNEGHQTLWAGFSLSEFMDTVVAFFATRDPVLNFPGTETTIVFEQERIDSANAYNELTGVFTAPQSGMYFFTFSSGAAANAEHRSHFVSSRETEHLTELWRGPGVNAGIDTLSSSVLYYLDAGQTMEVRLMAGQASNTQGTLLSFGGFLIDPKPPTAEVGWFVRTRTFQSGPKNPLEYEDVVFNQGSAWNPSSNAVAVKTNGYYYMSAYTGVTATDPIDLQLYKQTGSDDPSVLIDLYRDPMYNVAPDCMGRAVLVHLKSGDFVRLRLNSTSVSYSDTDKQTYFSGFLLAAKTDP